MLDGGKTCCLPLASVAPLNYSTHCKLDQSDANELRISVGVAPPQSTGHRWLAQYGGMKASDAKRLKELEAENARLKKLVANQALDIDMLKEISAGNY